jgi:hypothetical protein
MAETAEDRPNDARSDDEVFPGRFTPLSRLPQLRARPELRADHSRGERAHRTANLELPRMQPLDHGIRRPVFRVE